MITLLQPMNGKAPTHYIINNTSPETRNTTYNDLEEWKEAVIIDSILYGKDNIESGHMIELDTVLLVDELDIVTGANSKAQNQGKIL